MEIADVALSSKFKLTNAALILVEGTNRACGQRDGSVRKVRKLEYFSEGILGTAANI